MRYRFKVKHQHYKPGDLVPTEYPRGVISTMLTGGRIEPMPAPCVVESRAIETPEADKMMRPAAYKRKGARQ